MGMAAIAAYVRQLRDAQDISRSRLAELVGTSDNNIWRIEEQGQEPRGGLLLLIIQALHGSIDDAASLLRADADESEGRQRAMTRLSNRHAIDSERGTALAERILTDPDLRDALIRVADSLRS